ncbi:hypothetical protein JCM10207_002496 [Rhodosporidiobolus poonsookiae]
MPPKNKGKGKDKKDSGRPLKIKKVKEVVYDADSRKEYLTGFSKRKKAKQTARRNKAIEREKDEMRKMRAQLRDERKERAAHNVKVAQELYGDAGAGSDEDEDDDADSDAASDSDADSDASSVASAPEAAYETADALTTVSVAPLSLSRSPSPDPAYSAEAAPAPVAGPSQPQGSLYKKRVRGTVQARPKLTRKDRKEIATGGKKVKKKMLNRMKGTKARSAK